MGVICFLFFLIGSPLAALGGDVLAEEVGRFVRLTGYDSVYWEDIKHMFDAPFCGGYGGQDHVLEQIRDGGVQTCEVLDIDGRAVAV